MVNWINNPGNIRFYDNQEWQGQVGSHNGFVKFDTPEQGFRANTKIFQNYNKNHGIKTVTGLVNRWAPSHENDSDAYIQDVAARLGVDPNAELDFNNEDTLVALNEAIAWRENGNTHPYTVDQMRSGVQEALKKTK